MKITAFILAILVSLFAFSASASWLMIVEDAQQTQISCPEKLFPLNIEMSNSKQAITACVPLSILDKPPENVSGSEASPDESVDPNSSGPLSGPQFN